MDEQRKARKKLSDKQSSRTPHIDSCCTQWVEIDPFSVGILFLWSGRSSLNQAWFQTYGQLSTVFKIPVSIESKLEDLVKRIFRFFHPHHKSLPGDEEAVRLLESGIAGEQIDAISDDNAAAFFAFVESQQLFGRIPARELLEEAWRDWRKVQLLCRPG